MTTPLAAKPRRRHVPWFLAAASAATMLSGCGTQHAGPPCPGDRPIRRLRVVSVSIDGRSMPALSDYTGSGQQLQQRVLAIAGVRWPYRPGAPPGWPA